ncbi:MAG: SPOR domain-containing protein [Bacteroidaceae bacterium]|nr:SPOR domain-containing protein [Bacteroidaceae bacterium]MBR3895999.1 SPOR domain-containing protein [Bacteroidaceae bacterium]
MKELTKHIEALLVENDCVILPQFGGFVTNHTPARWIEEEKTFLPPYRTIGFNSQLKINDGLLVQSYMLTHDATYPEANRLAEAAIEKLSQELYKEGQVELHGIGTLRRTIVGEYQFDPTENGVITPALYGLGAVEMKTLAMLEEERKQKPAPRVEVETKVIEAPVMEKEEKDRTITIKIRHEWITNAVAAVAAVMLFFFLSTPVDNTYIEEENYASLGDISVFEQIKKESLLTTLMEAPATKAAPTVTMEKPASKPATTAKPAPIAKTEPTPVAKAEPTPAAKPASAPVAKAEPTPVAKAEPAPVANVAPAPQKKSASYNIIIASVPAESDAQHTIDSFAAKGHPGAFLIKGNGRFRIALQAFDTEAEAYDKVNELKKNPLFKDAWVLKTRK